MGSRCWRRRSLGSAGSGGPANSAARRYRAGRRGRAGSRDRARAARSARSRPAEEDDRQQVAGPTRPSPLRRGRGGRLLPFGREDPHQPHRGDLGVLRRRPSPARRVRPPRGSPVDRRFAVPCPNTRAAVRDTRDPIRPAGGHAYRPPIGRSGRHDGASTKVRGSDESGREGRLLAVSLCVAWAASHGGRPPSSPIRHSSFASRFRARVPSSRRRSVRGAGSRCRRGGA